MSNITGSRWWKFDFHTHTPHSTDTPWHVLTGAKELTPEGWLRKYMEAEIDCVAVTDHNGGGWIDRLRSELISMEERQPDWFRPITLFPGVEISVNSGIHVLAIMGSDCTTSTIDTLLGAVGYTEEKGNPEKRTSKSCIEVAQAITEHGGLCIPAHVDEDNGCMKLNADNSLEGDYQTTLALLNSGHVAAIEVRDSNWPAPGVLTDSKMNFPWVLGTDCHNFRGPRPPGSHYTWIKMGRPSLDGLRLALIDGSPLSVMRSDTTSDDPNSEPSMLIEQVEISQLRLMGRQSTMTAPFSPWLTTLIGGRGSGKSTLIDCLRLVFDRVDDLPDELRDSFTDFNRVAQSRRDRGAMLNDSEIRVQLRKETGRFRLTWKQTDPMVKITAEQPNGEWLEESGMVRQRFPVRLMSQKEIFAIARDPQSLLNLVDASPELTLNQWREKKSQLEAKFRRLVSEKRELISKTATKNRLEGELQEVLAGIRVFEEGSNRQTLQDYQGSRRQSRILDEQEAKVDQLIRLLESTAADATPADVDETSFDSETDEGSSALEMLRSSVEKQTDVVSKLTAMIGELNEFKASWAANRASSDWQTKATATEAAYTALAGALQEAGVANPDVYSQLVEKRQQIEKQLAEITSLETKIAEIDTEWREVVVKLSEHRVDLTKRRQTFLSEVLSGNDYVRVRVVPFGDDASQSELGYREAVQKLEAMEKDILSEEGDRGILASLYNSLSSDPDRRLTQLSAKIQDIKEKTASMAETGMPVGECTKWFSSHLQKLKPEDLDGIWTWFPQDVLQVDYRRDKNRDQWSPIEQGSPGQQTAAILAFILSHGEEPIILDQPEDDLDNHLIYDLIVQQIRESKRTRQIVVATHNPNIVVNGDAEMVLQWTLSQLNVQPLRAIAVAYKNRRYARKFVK